VLARSARTDAGESGQRHSSRNMVCTPHGAAGPPGDAEPRHAITWGGSKTRTCQGIGPEASTKQRFRSPRSEGTESRNLGPPTLLVQDCSITGWCQNSELRHSTDRKGRSAGPPAARTTPALALIGLERRRKSQGMSAKEVRPEPPGRSFLVRRDRGVLGGGRALTVRALRSYGRLRIEWSSALGERVMLWRARGGLLGDSEVWQSTTADEGAKGARFLGGVLWPIRANRLDPPL